MFLFSKHNLTNFFRFLISLAACQGAGLIGSFFTINSISNWYQYLNKPSFSPPNWIFGPVWTVLYTLMAISVFLIWKDGLRQKERKAAFILFFVHLFFNGIWSILFFGLQNPFLALLDIVVLLILISLVLVKFYKIHKTAGLLLVPYFFWVAFATLLNFFLWQLN